MRKIIYTLLLFGIMFSTGCGKQNPVPENYRMFTPRDSSYVVSYPEKWDAQRGRRSFQLMLISPREDSTDTFQENVIIFREDAEGKTLDEYVKYIIEEKLPKSLKDFSLISEENLSVNGLQSARLEYGFSYRKPAKSIGYVFEKDGFAYVVLGTSLDSTYAKYREIFDIIGKSFKFLK